MVLHVSVCHLVEKLCPAEAAAAILAAILNFSDCPKICACYSPGIFFGGAKDVESTEKKTLSVGARYTPLAA